MGVKTTVLTNHWTIGQVSESLAKTLERLDTALRVRNAAEEAGGALEEILETLYRMRELVMQASSETLGQSELDKIALALEELSRKIDAMSAKTGFAFQDFTGGAGEGIEVNLEGVSAASLGVSAGDIGDTVSGGERKAIYNQPLGVGSVPGKYDIEKLNSLGITFTVSETEPRPDGSGQEDALRRRQKH